MAAYSKEKVAAIVVIVLYRMLTLNILEVINKKEIAKVLPLFKHMCLFFKTRSLGIF